MSQKCLLVCVAETMTACKCIYIEFPECSLMLCVSHFGHLHFYYNISHLLTSLAGFQFGSVLPVHQARSNVKAMFDLQHDCF